MMVEMRVPKGVSSYSVAGRQVDVKDGANIIDVPTEHVETLKSHGFVEVALKIPSTDSRHRDHVAILRDDLVLMLKNLGIIVTDGAPDVKLVEALSEGCRRQSDRVAHEIRAAEARVRAEVAKTKDDPVDPVPVSKHK